MKRTCGHETDEFSHGESIKTIKRSPILRTFWKIREDPKVTSGCRKSAVPYRLHEHFVTR